MALRWPDVCLMTEEDRGFPRAKGVVHVNDSTREPAWEALNQLLALGLMSFAVVRTSAPCEGIQAL